MSTRRRGRYAAAVVVACVALVAGAIAVISHEAHPGDHPRARVGGPAAVRTSTHPNIMVVMLDDMRSDEMKYAPNMLRYVRDRGLDFRNSFSPYPLCCPARASFLLGKYAHNHRVLYHLAPYGFGAIDDHLTIAGRMQEAGYATALVGKYLNLYGQQPSKVTGGPSEHYVPAGWTDWMVGLQKSWPKGSGLSGGTYHYFDFTQNINGRTVQHRGKYSSDVVADEVRGLIDKYHRAAEPFFMWVTPVAPHSGGPTEPDDPRPLVNTRGRLEHFGTPARPAWVKGAFDRQITHAPGQPLHGPAEADVSDKPHNVAQFPETDPAEKLALRDAERQRVESIYAWDRQFGKIVARLKETGEYDRTVIMFTSDNGFYVGEHRQRLGKIKAYEPVIHVPLTVAGPGIPHGARYTPITTFDLTATILDLAGAAPLPDMDGASKAAELYGPDRGWDVPMVTEGLLAGVHRRPGSGVPPGLTTSGLRTGRYKLIKYATGESELYDLLRDPLELSSVWNDPAYARVQAEMLRTWVRFRSCKVSACQALMPADLRTTPQFLARQYRQAQRAQVRYYDR